MNSDHQMTAPAETGERTTAMAIQIDLNEKDQRTLQTMIEELNYQDATDLVEHVLSEYRAKRRMERLQSIGSRMFPDGSPTAGDLR